MGKSLQIMFISLFVLLLTVEPVAAYYIYGSTWYIYVIVVFVVVAISSCIGACVRYRRNQVIMEQRNLMVTPYSGTATAINVSTSSTTAAVNTGFYPVPPPGSYPTQVPYPTQAPYLAGQQYPPPAGMQQPPAYHAGQAEATPVKDPNMPPAYEDAVTSPNHPGNAPYPPQSAPYPPQTAQYPMQPYP